MSWNYRVIKHHGPKDTAWYGIHEVHYEGGKPCLWAERPELRADTLEELLRFTGANLVLEAGRLKRRVLDEAEMPEE